MHHWKARRLLPSLLDQTLPAPTEARVREHAESCARCADELDELLAIDGLLARLPAALVPADASAEADGRLRRLARWVADPAPTVWERSLTTFGAVAAACLFIVLVESGSLIHWTEPAGDPVMLASVLPETRLFPTGIR